MNDNRFPKSSRLRKRGDFLLVKNRGRCLRTRSFIIYILKSSIDGGPRLGITASKRVGGAVQRNRAKRLVREFFRQQQHLLDADCYYSIIAKQRACHLKLDQVNEELKVLTPARRSIESESCSLSC
ncbi:MAG: ribonuclease P protein component [Desulfuromonas sp.]|nr:MAG: ribonuclease P protein component [Desulfuromonas sp.]